MTLALTFPGQGSQTVGMGHALAQAYPTARHVFEEVDDALGEKLSSLIWEGPAEILMLTQNAQPALMAVSLAAMRAMESEGFSLTQHATYVAGHSLGEYSALAAAGSLKIADTACLLRTRGRAMQDAVPVGQGAMAVILGLDLEGVKHIAELASQGNVCQIANDNAAAQTVVSGDKVAVERAIDIAKSKGAKRAIILPVSAPFHCCLMSSAAEVMENALASIPISAPRVPLIANVTAGPVDDPNELRVRLIEQVCGTVRWRESMQWMLNHDVTHFLEVGVGNVLTGLARRIDHSLKAVSFGESNDIDKAKSLWEKSCEEIRDKPAIS